MCVLAADRWFAFTDLRPGWGKRLCGTSAQPSPVARSIAIYCFLNAANGRQQNSKRKGVVFFTPLASLPRSADSGSWNLRKSPGLSGLSLSQACRSFRGPDLLALEETYVWEKFTEPKTFRPKVGRGEPRRIDVLVRGAAGSDNSKIHWSLCLWSRRKTAREKGKHTFFSVYVYTFIYTFFYWRTNIKIIHNTDRTQCVFLF